MASISVLRSFEEAPYEYPFTQEVQKYVDNMGVVKSKTTEIMNKPPPEVLTRQNSELWLNLANAFLGSTTACTQLRHKYMAYRENAGNCNEADVVGISRL